MLLRSTLRALPRRAGARSHLVASGDAAELARFAAVASQWWDPAGPHGPLVSLSPLRTRFLTNAILSSLRKQGAAPPASASSTVFPLKGLKILDVGCGGGLVAEPLARLGADVTAVDICGENVRVAGAHAARDPTFTLKASWSGSGTSDGRGGSSSSGSEDSWLSARTVTPSVLRTSERAHSFSHSSGGSLTYAEIPAESIAESIAAGDMVGFNAVSSMDVIEHVVEPSSFFSTLSACMNRDASAMVVSTINRSSKAYLGGILAAEHILGLVEPGTHQYEKFVKPEEMHGFSQSAGLNMHGVVGLRFIPFINKWRVEPKNLDINYVACFSPAARPPPTN